MRDRTRCPRAFAVHRRRPAGRLRVRRADRADRPRGTRRPHPGPARDRAGRCRRRPRPPQPHWWPGAARRLVRRRRRRGDGARARGPAAGDVRPARHRWHRHRLPRAAGRDGLERPDAGVRGCRRRMLGPPRSRPGVLRHPGHGRRHRAAAGGARRRHHDGRRHVVRQLRRLALRRDLPRSRRPPDPRLGRAAHLDRRRHPAARQHPRRTARPAAGLPGDELRDRPAGRPRDPDRQRRRRPGTDEPDGRDHRLLGHGHGLRARHAARRGRRRPSGPRRLAGGRGRGPAGGRVQRGSARGDRSVSTSTCRGATAPRPWTSGRTPWRGPRPR